MENSKYTGVVIANSLVVEDYSAFEAKNLINAYFSVSMVSNSVSIDSIFTVIEKSDKFVDLKNLINNIFNEEVITKQLSLTRFAVFDKDTNSYTTSGLISINFKEFEIEFISRYGNRKPSEIFNARLDFGETVFVRSNTFNKFVTALNINPIISAINSEYYDKWKNLYDTVEAEYDFLKPFNIELEETINNTKHEQGDNSVMSGSVGDSGSDTRTATTTKTTSDNDRVEMNKKHEEDNNNTRTHTEDNTFTRTVTNDTTNNSMNESRYGFNSQTSVPTDTSETTNTHTFDGSDNDNKSINIGDVEAKRLIVEDVDIITKSGNQRESLSDSNVKNNTKTYNTKDSVDKTITDNGGREYRRIGNIGNTSSPELVMKERQKALFILREVIFADLANLLCRNTYYD